MGPYLSVIVPAHNAMGTLRTVLAAIAASEGPRSDFELLLADDGSTDETSLIAAEYCDRVVRLSGRPHGPAFARNRGVEASRGDILVFVDADVALHADVLARLARRFHADPETCAVFGSYDDRPPAPGYVSQYRNLLDHYMHQRRAGESETFWAGIGAVRREAFLDVGMFDEWHYSRPEIEDAELGRRLRRHRLRIVLDPEVQGTHLRAWTLRETIVSDFRRRGLPWMWLLLKEGAPRERGLRRMLSGERALTVLAGIGIVMALAALATRDWRPLLVSALDAGFIISAHSDFYRFLLRTRGLAVALAAIPLHLLRYGGNAASAVSGAISHTVFGEPMPSAEVTARAQIGIPTWPPAPRRSDQSIWEQQPEDPRAP